MELVFSTEAALMNLDEITGGSAYGAGTLAGSDGNRVPTENELEMARYQRRHVAEIAKKLVLAPVHAETVG